MSGVDLTEAIKAALNPVFDTMITDGPDGHVDGYEQIAAAAVTAAAPLIEVAVREMVAAEIEADLNSPGRSVSRAVRYGFEQAIKIARNGAPA